MSSPAPVGVPDGANLEIASCPFCGPDVPTSLVFKEPPLAVVRCTSCGLVFVSPRVAADRLAEVYGESYWRSPAAKDYGYTDYREDAANWLNTYRRRANVLSGRLAPGARVLDVGCAAGFFLEVMRDRGFDVWGLELSPSIAKEARDRLGDGRIHVGTLDDAHFDEASFDLVSLWDVIEHLPEPVEALDQVRSLLKPDGLLLLETQNVESRFAKLMGRRWHHFKQAEHLWHFSPATIDRLLAAGGFETIELTAKRSGKNVSLAFVAERAGRVHPFLSRVLAPLARVKAAPYVNLLDEMVVLARPA